MKHRRGLGIIAYGPVGIGKSSWAIRFAKHWGPLTCFSLKETGYDDLEEVDPLFPENAQNFTVRSWTRFLELLKEHGNKSGTVVIDGLTGLQQLIFDYILETYFKGSITAFDSWGKGPRIYAPREFVKLENIFTMLREESVNVVILAHDTVDMVKNPMGEDYYKSRIQVDKYLGEPLLKWAQNVFFMTFDVIQEENQATTKASSNSARFIFTQASPTHDAKNRLNLPRRIVMGTSPDTAYDNFYKALPEIYHV